MDTPHSSGSDCVRPVLSWALISLLVALFITLLENNLFWQSFMIRLGVDQRGDLWFLAVMGLASILALNLVFSLFAYRPIFKPFLALILLISAIVSYFADNFGVIVDKAMIHNIFETDVTEASELLTWPLVGHVLLYAGLPIALLCLVRVRYAPWRRELLLRFGVIFGSLVLIAGMAFSCYKQVALFGRANRDLQVFINPTYAVTSFVKVFKKTYFSHKDQPLRILAADARRTDDDPKSVVVLVVGETARSSDFSLNGYPRDTNPELRERDVIDFADVESCGTSTAESLPCMFSSMERSNYSRGKAERSENLLDLLQRTGVNVLWRDNDSGSKGVADRVAFENLYGADDPEYCSEGNCFDEILLKDLGQVMAKGRGDMLIVLHEKGSHGPSYYKRTPLAFKRFLPECSQDDVQDCPQQSIINAYDNTILYTDHVLARLIDLLKSQDFATAMLYVSDHGESLGENGLYLHGLPYALAPAEQTHVPMVFWASNKFLEEKQIDRATLQARSLTTCSHDNLFHSLLGLFDIKTNVYQPDLDLFAPPLQHRS